MFTYDVLATEALDRLDELSPPTPKSDEPKPSTGETTDNENPPPCHRDLYALLEQHHHQDATLTGLWTDLTTTPSWVSWPQLARGQKVFYRYAGPSVVALTFHSLLGGMGSRRVVETLSRTGGFGVHIARRRLLETFHHILDITRDLPSIQPGGDGFRSSIRVRLLHASVRRRILRLAGTNPSYFDISTLGIPISDLDSIATILTFSSTLLHIGFPRQGIIPTQAEEADYLALWRYIAHLLGTPTHSFLRSPTLAKAAMESLLLSEITPTLTSQRLANNIIAALQNTPPAYASANFLRAEAYWLNGAQLAKALGIPRPPWYHTLLVAGQCGLFLGLCYAKRAVPGWDEASIARLRVRMRELTLELTEGREATHGFRHVPGLEVKEEEGGGGREGRKGMGVGAVEQRNLNVLLVVAALVGGMAWFVLRSVGAFRLLWSLRGV
ncbi:tat pathway signal sequence, partial [Cercophora scortea]